MMRVLVTLVSLLLSADALVLSRPLPQAVSIAHGSRACSAVMMAKKKQAGKMITVVLEADIEGLGSKGELAEVKPAYAENFLVAKGMGSIASKELIKQLEEEAAAAAAAAAAQKKKATDDKVALDQKFGKAGMKTEVQVKDGEVQDTVDSETVAAMLTRAGIAVDSSAIEMPEVKDLGSVLVEVKLHPEVSATVKLNVEKSKITLV